MDFFENSPIPLFFFPIIVGLENKNSIFWVVFDTSFHPFPWANAVNVGISCYVFNIIFIVIEMKFSKTMLYVGTLTPPQLTHPPTNCFFFLHLVQYYMVQMMVMSIQLGTTFFTHFKQASSWENRWCLTTKTNSSLFNPNNLKHVI